MRHRKGMGGIIGIIALALIFFIGGVMFAPEIFGNLETQSVSNVSGTIYQGPFHDVNSTVYIAVHGGIPVMYIMVLIIGIIVAMLYFARI